MFGCAESSWLCGLLSSCGEWDTVHCTGFSSDGFPCGLLWLWREGSVVAAPTSSVVSAHRLSSSMARGIFPDRD